MSSEKIIEDFIAYFKSLPEREQFKLGGLFNHHTGGKLSPFDSPNPVSVALIQVEDEGEIKLLGVRRDINPKKGEIALPGGFVNTLEQPNIAALRETLEETGLKTDLNDYMLLDAKTTPGNQMLLFYVNKHVYSKDIMKNLVINSEVSEFMLIDSNTPLAFPLHKEMVDIFFNGFTPPVKPSLK